MERQDLQTILIVDDNPKIIQVAVNILKVDHYKILVSTSGLNALSKIPSINIDLILLDVLMPEMNGYELFDELKKIEKTKDIPIIFLTALNDSENIIKAFEMGAVDYICKPFNPQELRIRVKTHLKLRKTLKELQRKNILLRERTIKDPLTKLYNRRYIEDTLRRDFLKSKRYDTPLTCIMIDIDDFKLINDNYGHLIGDKVLKDLSKLLIRSSRKSDLCGRYGGEEFIIVVQQDEENAFLFAEKLIKKIRELNFTYKNVQLNLTVSIGIASYNSNLANPDELIKNADDALYKTKKQGKNNIIIYNEK